MQILAPIPLERVGNYQVLERLGAGGMGVVYKAVDLKLKRTVALKFLAEEDFDATDREHLLREARAASALDHANIGTVYGVEDTEDGRLCIVMAFYDGETLAQKLRHGPLSRERAINIACQVARGLHHAHLHGVIHRDIKPSNVIITSDGVAKIVDFGLARRFTPSATTESGGASGTLLYMAPEQAMAKAVDARADIWSLGVMLYQMLTGRLPFAGENAAATLMGILHEPPAALDELPEELQLIVYRALAKEPLARYQNCAELLREVEKFAPEDRERTASISKRKLHQQLKLAARAVAPHATDWRILAVAVAIISFVFGMTWLQSSGRWSFATRGGNSDVSHASPAYESYVTGRKLLARYDRRENLDRAVSEFEKAIKADPEFALGFAGLSEAYWYRYQMSRDTQWRLLAERYAKHALELNDRLPTVHVTLGRLHSLGKQTELAQQEFEKALKLERYNADALLGLAGVYEVMGRVEAEETYKKAIALQPDEWSGYYELGNFYFHKRDYERAVEEWRKVVSLTPDNPRGHSSLGVALQELGRIAESEAELKTSIAVQPTYAAYAMLGRLFYQQRRWQEAAELAEQATRFTRTDYRVWAALGVAYEWLNETAQAARAYREEFACLQAEAKLKPDDATIQSEIGLLYSKQGKNDLAIRSTNLALARAQDDPAVWSNAGEVYENLGQRKRALEFIRKAMQKGWTMERLERNPGLRNLLGDPQFKKVGTLENRK